MTQAIRDVHTALADLIGGLSITEPVTMAMGTVWPYVPASRQTIIPPTAIVMHDLTKCTFEASGYTRQEYDMHVQVFVQPAEVLLNVGADIANAFLDALITAVSNSITLSGAVQLIHEIHGNGQNGETLALLNWAGKGYVGLDVVIPIALKDDRGRAA